MLLVLQAAYRAQIFVARMMTRDLVSALAILLVFVLFSILLRYNVMPLLQLQTCILRQCDNCQRSLKGGADNTRLENYVPRNIAV